MQQNQNERQMIQSKIKNAVVVNVDILGSIAAKMQYCQDLQQYFNNKKRTLGSNIAGLAALQCVDINKYDYQGLELTTHLQNSFVGLAKDLSFDKAIEALQQFQDALYEIHREVTVLALKSIIATTDSLTLKSIASEDTVIQAVIKNPADLSNYEQSELDRIFNMIINSAKILERIVVQTPDSQSPIQKRRHTVRPQPPQKQPEVSKFDSVYNWLTGTTPTKQEVVKQERVALINGDVSKELNMNLQSRRETTESSNAAHQRSHTIIGLSSPIKQEPAKQTSTSGLATSSSQNSMGNTESKSDEASVESKNSVKHLSLKLGTSINLGKQPQDNKLTQNRANFHQSAKVEKQASIIPTRKGASVDQQELAEKLRKFNNKPGL